MSTRCLELLWPATERFECAVARKDEPVATAAAEANAADAADEERRSSTSSSGTDSARGGES